MPFCLINLKWYLNALSKKKNKIKLYNTFFDNSLCVSKKVEKVLTFNTRFVTAV